MSNPVTRRVGTSRLQKQRCSTNATSLAPKPELRVVSCYKRFLSKTLLHLPDVSEVYSQFASKRVKLTTTLSV